MSRIRASLTYANVMATVAVFIALVGSATAAVLITGKNVKNGSLSGADVKNNSLESADVKDGGLLAKDFKAGQLPAGLKGDVGPKGDAGAKGDLGPKGDAGPGGARGPSDAYTDFDPEEGAVAGGVLAGVQPPDGAYVVFANAIVDNNTSSNVTVSCQIGGTQLGLSVIDTTKLSVAAHSNSNVILGGAADLPLDATSGNRIFFGCAAVSPAPADGTFAYKDIDLGAVQVGTLH